LDGCKGMRMRRRRVRSKQEMAGLREEIDRLNHSKIAALEDCRLATDRRAELEKEVQALEKRKNTWQTTNCTIGAESSTLLGDLTTLQTQHASLTATIESNQSTNASLQSTIRQQQAQPDYLSAACE